MASGSRGSYSIGDSAELEGNLTLNDRLKAFKSSNFDPDAYVTSKCQHMNEKEIRHLCSYLVELKKASAEEMRKSVYANYSAFIRTSKEITILEGQLLSIRNLLSTQSALIQGLAEGVRIDSLSAAFGDAMDEDTISSENEGLSKMDKWLVDFLDTLEVLLAERRVDEALTALEEGQSIVKEAKNRHTMSRSALYSLQTAISEQRRKLADQLAEATCQPSTRGVELRSAVSALKKLGDSPRAHTLLLNSHHLKLQRSIQIVRSSSTLCGGALTASLSQLVFSTIGQAARDSLAVFGEEPAYSSELVTWAVKETEGFAHLLQKHFLASSAAAGVLRVVTESIQICLGHCSLLEDGGLALSPVLLRLFRPYVEQALSGFLRKIEQNSAALAASDDWSLTYSPPGVRHSSSTASLSGAVISQPQLSISAHRFNLLVQELLEDIAPLENLQLYGPALDGVLQVFSSYVDLLINALPGSTENEENLEGSFHKIVSMAETDAQQIALLANASLLSEELLPRAGMKLLPFSQSYRVDNMTPRKASDRQNRFPEQREWKRRLQRLVDGLRDSFCRHHALELIFTEDGEIRLNPQIYISLDELMEEPEWFPSPIFQELFAKLSRMASIATDMFVGRERFATILLLRLTETVVLFLSDDQNFWVEIEEGPKSLGPYGLQQFYLDMQFVMLFASQGRYLSRHLQQVIKTIIARAIDAVAANGLDPYSVLPEDDWFVEVAEIAIKMISGKAEYGNGERDVTSPIVGTSSMSSLLTHGSNG
ncbi:hypothetical protein Pint_23123 [Pistacia integerrima]|uniref:Uncharacterized protein n=1 Tax=Pistacia integerrima TaxID=434235 RepID=A0ACC0YL11_9ROSI|nr:hypothetical protein Pint_23123 [Pistacia integerrima]